MNNKKILLGVAVMVLIAGAFYGGMAYAKNRQPRSDQFAAGQFNRGQFNAAADGAASVSGAGRVTEEGFAAGEIISKDSTGITVKMQSGGSRIVLVGPSTEIAKTVTGTADDLKVGTNVTVIGRTGSGGLFSAETVQIRPEGAAIPFGRQGRTQ